MLFKAFVPLSASSIQQNNRHVRVSQLAEENCVLAFLMPSAAFSARCCGLRDSCLFLRETIEPLMPPAARTLPTPWVPRSVYLAFAVRRPPISEDSLRSGLSIHRTRRQIEYRDVHKSSASFVGSQKLPNCAPILKK